MGKRDTLRYHIAYRDGNEEAIRQALRPFSATISGAKRKAKSPDDTPRTLALVTFPQFWTEDIHDLMRNLSKQGLIENDWKTVYMSPHDSYRAALLGRGLTFLFWDGLWIWANGEAPETLLGISCVEVGDPLSCYLDRFTQVQAGFWRTRPAIENRYGDQLRTPAWVAALIEATDALTGGVSAPVLREPYLQILRRIYVQFLEEIESFAIEDVLRFETSPTCPDAVVPGTVELKLECVNHTFAFVTLDEVDADHFIQRLYEAHPDWDKNL